MYAKRFGLILSTCQLCVSLVGSSHGAECAQPASKPTGADTLLPPGWDPLAAGNAVLERLISVTAPRVRGAHDAEFVLVGRHAYIVSTVNDARRGHSARDDEYAAMSIVNLDTLEVEEASLIIAQSEQVFANETLPVGQCWVPRIIQKDENTLRVFFVSQGRGTHYQLWYRDFDLETRTFFDTIHRAHLKTSLGIFDTDQHLHFHACAAAHGFSRPPVSHGLYIFDSFKEFDGVTYVAINNFPGRQNALATINEARDTFEIVGHINDPEALALSEVAVERLPDGTWMAILRSEAGNRRYAFSTSVDGHTWTPAEHRDFIDASSSSKPTFNRFGDVYYLGWQDAARIGDEPRSVFNIDVSRDGQTWERKYRFETANRFEYPTFKEHDGTIWLTISGNRQQTILFGKLE